MAPGPRVWRGSSAYHLRPAPSSRWQSAGRTLDYLRAFCYY
jgi:hypothetical protein